MKRNIVGICAVAAGLCACRSEKAVERPLTAVKTVQAELTSISNEVRYSGVVAPDTQVDLSFRVAGYVEQIGSIRDASGAARELHEGDVVQLGAVLARLRPAEYQARASYAQAVTADAAATLAALRAQLAEAEASIVQSSRDYARAEALFAEKAMTRSDFDAVEARRDAAAARRNSVQAQIEAQKARMEGAGAQFKEASLSLSDTALTAPFPGIITAKRIARGSLAGAGTPAFSLADTRLVKVSFGVPDLALPGFKPGGMLTVLVEAMPGREFRGRITSIAPVADSASRVFPVEVTVVNDGQALRPGMVATVVTGGAVSQEPLPSVPLAAVVSHGPQGYGVYTVDSLNGNDRIHLQPVSLGAVRGNAVLITAGLRPGQRVVATGGLQLTDGEPVRQIP